MGSQVHSLPQRPCPVFASAAAAARRRRRYVHFLQVLASLLSALLPPSHFLIDALVHRQVGPLRILAGQRVFSSRVLDVVFMLRLCRTTASAVRRHCNAGAVVPFQTTSWLSAKQQRAPVNSLRLQVGTCRRAVQAASEIQRRQCMNAWSCRACMHGGPEASTAELHSSNHPTVPTILCTALCAAGAHYHASYSIQYNSRTPMQR